jgi:hypothetical protein
MRKGLAGKHGGELISILDRSSASRASSGFGTILCIYTVINNRERRHSRHQCAATSQVVRAVRRCIATITAVYGRSAPLSTGYDVYPTWGAGKSRHSFRYRRNRLYRLWGIRNNTVLARLGREQPRERTSITRETGPGHHNYVHTKEDSAPLSSR